VRAELLLGIDTDLANALFPCVAAHPRARGDLAFHRAGFGNTLGVFGINDRAQTGRKGRMFPDTGRAHNGIRLLVTVHVGGNR
jgi:hypothetical protein